MTTITFYRDSDDLTFGIEASGHAGFARKGKDIVCAAISSLMFTTMNSMESILNKVVISEGTDISGNLEFTVKDYRDRDVQLLFESLSLGLNDIQEQYPKNLKLTIRRCKP